MVLKYDMDIYLFIVLGNYLVKSLNDFFFIDHMIDDQYINS